MLSIIKHVICLKILDIQINSKEIIIKNCMFRFGIFCSRRGLDHAVQINLEHLLLIDSCVLIRLFLHPSIALLNFFLIHFFGIDENQVTVSVRRL